jgi:hypothetical protein
LLTLLRLMRPVQAMCRQCQDAGKCSALMEMISRKPPRDPPAAAARTSALTPRAAPTCRMNCLARGRAPHTSHGRAVLHYRGERRREQSHPGADTSAATMTQAALSKCHHEQPSES